MTYDIIIIGAGSAGFSAYKEAVKHTDNILIINDGPWDTMCARVGCMPSKVLISSANQLHSAKTLNKVGFNQPDINIDTSTIMNHVRELRDSFTAATQKQADSWSEKHKISGKAKFLDAKTIIVNNKKYVAKSFILAVGSTPKVNHEWKNQIKDRFITSDNIFELPTLPSSMAIIGSGVIALELAQALQRLGVEITIFARSTQIGSITSPTLQKVVHKEILKELNIQFEKLPETVSLKNNKVHITYDGSKTLDVDYILNATGRDSLLSTLNLTAINSQFNNIKELPIHKTTKQLAEYPIFIVGDAFPNLAVQHIASYEGKYAVKNCLNSIKDLEVPTPLSITFSSPQMAICGQSYTQLKAIEFVTGYASYEDQGRAKALGKNYGALEIYADKNTQEILGAEFFVESAEHLGHLLSWMIHQKITVKQLLKQPFYHPTLEEGIRTALRDLQSKL